MGDLKVCTVKNTKQMYCTVDHGCKNFKSPKTIAYIILSVSITTNLYYTDTCLVTEINTFKFSNEL